MKRYYLRVDGVNLRNFVYDTADLSTVRGGGLLLLHAARDLTTMPDPATKRGLGNIVNGFAAVSTGASAALYAFEAAGNTEAERIRADVERALRDHDALRHATFVVDIVEAGLGGVVEPPDRAPDPVFVRAREILLAENRWRQWRQPTVAVPTRNADPPPGRACSTDGVRAPTPPWNVGGKPVSESVGRRRKYGLEQKRTFYHRETGVDLGSFTEDFEQLADSPAEGRLDGKIGVIYLDGNGFGKLQTEGCTTQTRQEAFDASIKRYRKEFLTGLLETIKRDRATTRPRWRNGERVRLETLLWGGDELMLVVPAWQAWATLRLFFEIAQESVVAGTPGARKPWHLPVERGFDGQRLTHAGGLVFCHRNAPIHQIASLARRLADRAKGVRDRNAFGYLILESFDHVGRDLDHYRKQRHQAGGQPLDLTLADVGDAATPTPPLGLRMREAETVLPLLRETVPRRRLHAAVRGWQGRSPTPRPVEDPVAKSVEKDVLAQAHRAFGRLETGSDPEEVASAVCYHLLELWDYVGV